MSTLLPYPGIKVWETEQATIMRLHYLADPMKGLGRCTYVPDINMELTPWALGEYTGMADKGLYRQEYEIDFEATQGARLFYMEDAATLVQSKDIGPIPHEWTRWYGLDPHPRVPHSHLWGAVDPYGDRWYYREFWPSKIYGKPGNVPEDDNRVKIRQHVEIVHWLESAENPENGGKAERIHRRVIDYAARAFGKGTVDDEPQLNFQQRYERISRKVGKEKGEPSWKMTFVDCVKDHDAGIELVNDGLKPLWVEGPDGNELRRSRIHIVADKCPELVYQIHTNRYPKLTPLQADTRDPLPDPIQKRRHGTDNLRYIEMDKPRFIRTGIVKSDYAPLHAGVDY
jgi:hypothetical protein